MANDRSTRTLDLLIKFLGMTGSSHDGEALAAMRKAAEYAVQLGGWEALLRGKVKVIEDPFSKVAAPPPPSGPRAATNSPPRRGPPPPHPPWASPWGGTAGTASPPPKPPRASHPNLYAGHCWTCGILVGEKKGLRRLHKGKWIVFCTPCGGSTAPIPDRRATKIKASLGDIANAI